MPAWDPPGCATRGSQRRPDCPHRERCRASPTPCPADDRRGRRHSAAPERTAHPGRSSESAAAFVPAADVGRGSRPAHGSSRTGAGRTGYLDLPGPRVAFGRTPECAANRGNANTYPRLPGCIRMAPARSPPARLPRPVQRPAGRPGTATALHFATTLVAARSAPCRSTFALSPAQPSRPLCRGPDSRRRCDRDRGKHRRSR